MAPPLCMDCGALIVCRRCQELENELMTARAERDQLEANAFEAIRRLTQERDDLKATLQDRKPTLLVTGDTLMTDSLMEAMEEHAQVLMVNPAKPLEAPVPKELLALDLDIPEDPDPPPFVRGRSDNNHVVSRKARKKVPPWMRRPI